MTTLACGACGTPLRRRNLDRRLHPDKVDRLGYYYEWYCPTCPQHETSDR